MKPMRAKVRVGAVTRTVNEAGEVCQEQVEFHAVAATAYPADGSDEDNTYAKYSPSAKFSITIANPALFATYAPGQKFYVDFHPAEK
ncbi:MAG: hypothetical protein NW200_12440 [Hyphomonadaceae bacterium]|nr:hypothetical protein [Hyphomonadaceae bacterium]